MAKARMFLAAVLLASLPAVLPAADYRGMTAGWPVYANGYYPANYPANYGPSPAYYVARPTVTAGYAARPTGTMYVPARAAYANPSYFGAYGTSTVAYRPVSAAGYSPAAPATAYYAPVAANYAPANSYAVTPAGQSSAGSEAAAYYGQPQALNYVPPRFTYRTTYAPVPVYMYRPVTAYDPITAQPVTCLQATTSTCCQPQRSRSWFSWLHPSNWFSRGSSCGSAPAPTTSYCGAAASQCGQPYYPVQPLVPGTPTITLPPNVIPAVPSTTFPGGTLPGGTFPGTPLPQAGPRIPPPPTGAAVPGTRIITTPADSPPRLGPGPAVTPLPSTTNPPGGTFFPGSTSPLPASPAPSTTIPPGGSFPTGPGAFGTGTNYAPAIDPYSGAKQPPASGAVDGANLTPSHSVFGSGYKPADTDNGQAGASPSGNVIRAPDLAPAMPPSVQTVPDMDNARPPRPTSSAPALLNPKDKTAHEANHRWAVVPAVWPVKSAGLSPESSTRPIVNTAGRSTDINAAAPPPSYHYDDRGWKSAAF